MAKDATLIETASGPVRGIWEVNGALSWRGIPYAEPPIGDLRWKAPRRAPAHEGVLAATRFGAISTQRIEVMPGIDPMLWGTAIGSEDCLTLNVWAPGAQTNQDSGLPVMVWLHGGSNVSGSGSFFNGCYLSAQQNVVVVTLNYRLGLFGWFSHPALRKVAETELDRSPNFALLDIILALKWIRENIAAYGGNPNNVTLFGESAGAMNTMALLYSPLAKDLFHKVIMQSGGLRQTPVEVAEQHVADDRSEFSSTETAAKLLLNRREAESRELARVQVAGMTDSELMKLVYSASAEELIATYTPDIALAVRLPQVIPDDIVVPAGQPWELIAEKRRVHPVPVMLGSNRDEMKFFMGFNPIYVTIVPGKEIRINDLEQYNLHARYLSDRWAALGVDEIARRLSAHNPDVYAYRFDWDEQPISPEANLPQVFGAAHAMELPFVFNDFDGMELFAMNFTEQNRATSERLAAEIGEYWANFAFTGQPARGRSGKLREWPRWGDGMKLILDTAPNGGRLQKGMVTMESLNRRFLADTTFPSNLEKEIFRRVMFEGRESWEAQFSKH